MHALTGPLRYGLTPVDIVFGEVRYRFDREVLLTGEPCLDPNGHLLVFIGLSETRRPITIVPGENLARMLNPHARQRAANNLHAARLHCQSP